MNGFIVEHYNGITHLTQGFGKKRLETLWLGGRKATVFKTRAAAKWAITKTCKERSRWLQTLPDAKPDVLDTDSFNKRHKYIIIRLVSA